MVMKNFCLFALLAVSAATTLSCTKDSDGPVKMKTISVTIGCPQELSSKTQLVNGNKVYWTAADKNLICFTNNTATDAVGYDLTSTQSGLSATKTFTGSIPDGDEPVFFVYDRNRKTSAGTHNFKFKKTYLTLYSDNDQRIGSAPWGNTFHVGCNYAVVRPGDSEVKHVFGFIKWTNNGTAIKYVKMEPLVSSENIIGALKISFSGKDLVIGNAYTSSVNYVYSGLQSGASNSNIPADNSYYAIVYPRTYHGLKVTITLADGNQFVLKTDETLVVERGKFLDLGVLPKEPVTVVMGGVTFTAGQDYDQGWNMDF